MDFDTLVDDSAQQAQPAAQTPPATAQQQPALAQQQPGSVPGTPPQVLPKFDDLQDDQEKYGTTEQQVLTGIEGAAQGFISKPAAVWAETNLLGVSPEDIAGREAANPWTHGLAEAGGLGVGLLTGTGEAGLIAKVGEGVAGAAKLGKIGSAVLRGAIENGIFQGQDEIGNAMLGKADPEAPVASALAHIGAASLFGGAAGGLFGSIASKLENIGGYKVGTKLSNFAEDVKARLGFRQSNPELLDALHDELTDFHVSTSSAANEVYGASGLKSQAIEQLTRDVLPEAVSSHVAEIAEAVTKSKVLQNEPLFQDALAAWKSSVDASTKPADVFQATDLFKRQLQEWGQYNKQFVPLSEQPFRNASKQLGFTLRNALEDTKIWGDAAELQKGVNKAFSEFLPAQKDFLSKFTSPLEGVRVVDKGKVNTYLNQLGKPSAEIKQSMMKNYVDAAEKYREQIANLHTQLGVESPIQPSSLNVVRSTLNESTPGSQFADMLVDRGAQGFATKALEHVGGAVGGHAVGGIPGAVVGYVLGPYLDSAIGRPLAKGILKHAAPAILKVISSDNPVGSNISKVLNYASDASKGATKINNGIEALFKVGGQQAISTTVSEKEREKLKKFIESGALNQQIQNQISASQPHPATSPSPSFAAGGDVKQPAMIPGAVPTSEHDPIADHFPEQNIMMQTAKGRINNYLNSLRPQPSPSKLPFDDEMPNKEGERKYDRAIDLAIQPLTILNHIKAGTITPEHVQHFTSLYPELHQHLSKKITERISNQQLDGEKPTYKVRQGLSMFLGAPLDSTFKPENMQAAQGVYMPQPSSPPNAPVTKNKRNTSKLGDASKQYQTTTQAAEARAKA